MDNDDLKESDKKLTELDKYIHLWKLFYSYRDNLIKSTNNNTCSSFCFLGSGLEIIGINELPKNINLELKLTFLNEQFFKYINANDDLISTETIHIKYSILPKSNNINSIIFSFKLLDDYSILKININDAHIKFEYELPYKININEEKISILNNFYGQLKSIEIYMLEEMKNKNEIIKFNRLISPFPLKDNGGIVFYSNFKFNKYNNEKKENKIFTNIFKNENNQSTNNNNEINAKICIKIK